MEVKSNIKIGIEMKLKNILLLILPLMFISACSSSSSGDSTPEPTSDNNAAGNQGEYVIDPTTSYLGHESLINTAVELSDGRIASAGNLGVVHLWHPADTTTTLATYNGHTDDVHTILELNDGRVASAGNDNTIQIWNPNDTDNGAVVIELNASTQVFSIVELPNGNLVAGYRENADIQIIEPTSPETIVATYAGHSTSGIIAHNILLPDGRIVSRKYTGDEVHIWDPVTLEASFIGNVGGDGIATVLLPDGRIASTGRPSVIWDPADPESENTVIFERDGGAAPRAIAQLADGRMVTGTYVWNPENPEEYTNLPRQRGSVAVLLPLRDGRLVVTNADFIDGSTVNHLRIWSPDEF